MSALMFHNRDPNDLMIDDSKQYDIRKTLHQRSSDIITYKHPTPRHGSDQEYLTFEIINEIISESL